MSADRRFCVYCSPEEVNDATFRYIAVLRRGLVEAGLKDAGMTQDTALLRQCDYVVAISCMPAMRAMLLHPQGKLIHWFQGIEAVERRYLHKGWRGFGRYVLWSAMEAIVLRRARLKLFVSEEMRSILRDADRPGSRSLVIPCYNVDFDPDAWGGTDRYRRLDLVYAGSLYPWQCVEDSLQAFKALQQRREDARLTIFTREVERAKSMCAQAGLVDVHVESLPPEKLLSALRRFSFGFILREAMPINEVSTPTKFSTYLGAGVIPIMTRATPALARLAQTSPYQIVVDAPSSHDQIAAAVQALAEAAPDEANVRDSFAGIFDTFFDDSKHAHRIAQVFAEIRC